MYFKVILNDTEQRPGEFSYIDTLYTTPNGVLVQVLLQKKDCAIKKLTDTRTTDNNKLKTTINNKKSTQKCNVKINEIFRESQSQIQILR